jgi:predicted phosphohydrolase
MKLVLISDTHGRHHDVTLPPGDVLIHAGDFSRDGGLKDVRNFFSWMEAQPFAHKILIAGNHDAIFEKWYDGAMVLIKDLAPSVTYLQDTGVIIDGVRFWGSPVQPEFFNWSFNRKRGAEIRRHWDLIPEDTDVLITHGPARNILDITMDGTRDGCDDLRTALARVKPLVFVHGHFHGAYGRLTLNHEDGAITKCFNASICNERYHPSNKPFEYDLK